MHIYISGNNLSTLLCFRLLYCNSTCSLYRYNNYKITYVLRMITVTTY